MAELEERAAAQAAQVATLSAQVAELTTEVGHGTVPSLPCMAHVPGIFTHTSSKLTLDCCGAQRDSLTQENAVLRTNISSLFRTAQLEIERKTAEIAGLRRR